MVGHRRCRNAASKIQTIYFQLGPGSWRTILSARPSIGGISCCAVAQRSVARGDLLVGDWRGRRRSTAHRRRLDRVAVRVVIDSYQVAVAPGAKALVSRSSASVGVVGPAAWPALISEFGLSLHVEVATRRRDPATPADYGFTPGAHRRRRMSSPTGAARRARAEPWPLRSLRRPRWIPAPDEEPVAPEAAVLHRRRGVLLLARVDRAAGEGELGASTARRWPRPT